MNLPIANKRLNLLEDKLVFAEREVEVRNVELKVLSNKYNSLREDYSNTNLAHQSVRRDNEHNSASQTAAVNLVREIQEL